MSLFLFKPIVWVLFGIFMIILVYKIIFQLINGLHGLVKLVFLGNKIITRVTWELFSELKKKNSLLITLK